MNTRILSLIICIVFISSCETAPKPPANAEPVAKESTDKANPAEGMPIPRTNLTDSNKDVALAYFNALESADGSFFRVNISKDNHVQHHASYEHGTAGYKQMVKGYKNAAPKIDVYRVAELNEFVITHSVLTDSLSRFSCMDAFKFENGKIVEHYFGREELKDLPGGPDLSYSGANVNTHDDDDALRIKVAANFIRFSRIGGDQNKNKVMVSANYTEHNPHLAKSKDPMGNYYYDLKAKGIDQEYDGLTTAIGGGNFVLTISSGTRNGAPVEIFDLFRFNGQKIAEHWDVVQAL